MKSLPLKPITEINTGLSLGVTFKVGTSDTPDPPDAEQILYLEKVVALGIKFEKAGWQVKEQLHGPDRYLVCAKYTMDQVDLKLINESRKTVDAFAPKSYLREWFNY